MKPLEGLEKAGPEKLGKTSPKVVYMTADMGPFKCGHCEYFSAPYSCEKVSGAINPDDCCNLYESNDGDDD